LLECRSLEVLDLSYNYLDALPSEVFDLSSLSLLLVGYNRLSEVSEERIGRLTNLTRLELQGNRLIAPPAQVWKLWRLQSLVLSGNAISSLNFPSYEGGSEEERVRESVEGKEKGADGDPFKCTSLSLSLSLSLSHTHTHTHIHTIGIMKLDVLELGGNMLRDFPAELFHHLRYLKVLNLSNNYIEMLRPEFGKFSSHQ